MSLSPQQQAIREALELGGPQTAEGLAIALHTTPQTIGEQLRRIRHRRPRIRDASGGERSTKVYWLSGRIYADEG